jgi:hypothetical protein
VADHTLLYTFLDREIPGQRLSHKEGFEFARMPGVTVSHQASVSTIMWGRAGR